MTPVPYPIAYALIGGLSTDSIVKHPQALEIFPEVKLIDFDTAAKDALENTHPSFIERIWEDERQATKIIKHEGCFIDYREVTVKTEPEKVLETIANSGSRELIMPEGYVPASNSKLLDSKAILFPWKKKFFGTQWIEWRAIPSLAKNMACLAQTVFFCPRGLFGFLYWYLFYPFHLRRFRSFLDKIVKQSEKQ
jgi:hypothetical protein